MKKVSSKFIVTAIVLVLALAAVVIMSLTLGKTTQIDCETCGADGKVALADCTACEGNGCKICDNKGSVTVLPATCEDCEGKGTVAHQSVYYSTFMSLVPAFVAILLALLTKEVYSSLFIGVVLGALFHNNFNVVGSMDTLLNDGFISAVSGTAGIFIFLVVLGVLVALVNKTGGSAAFGRWAQKHIKTKVGASICTFILGVLIFIDDYFNCLTVGSVMRPVTDKHKISRAKLAYLIDATAAPICMIAPISSWAAAVSEYTKDVPGDMDGLGLFCSAIPYNFYSLLTFVFIIGIVVMKIDYGPMKLHEQNALKGDLFTFGTEVKGGEELEDGNEKGIVIDLLLPIILLVAISVVSLIYVGGFFDPTSSNYNNFIGSFGDTDATIALPLGSIITLIITVIYLILRGLISFKESMACIPKGFIAMVPAILILTMATALKNMTGLLGSDMFVESALAGAGALQNFLPAIIFLVACVIAFATGTSWGTFGILIPIVLQIFPNGGELMIIGMSACLAGAVCGDHCSPISDTTIMSSAGAQCEHVNHVSTQLPYALTVAGVSFVAYIIAGLVQNVYISLSIAAVMMVATLLIIKFATKKSSLAIEEKL